MKKRSFFACLLIAAGLGIMAYPWLKVLRLEQRQNQLMEQWIDTVNNGDASMGKELLTKNDEKDRDYEGGLTETREEPYLDYDTEYLPEDMEGILYISSIGLKCPVLFGESKRNLNLGICRLYTSADAGGYGNCCLSGHNSRIYGRQFNRLKEVSAGDNITLYAEQAVYNYLATDVFKVTENDVWVLGSDFLKKEITLITCDYSQKPIGRLIVKGILAEE